MGKGTKKKKNNSNKNAVKNAQLKTTKNVASETTSEKEFEKDVLNEIEEEVKEDFVEAEYEEIELDEDDYEENESNDDDEIELDEDDYEENESNEDDYEEIELDEDDYEENESNDDDEIELDEDDHEEIDEEEKDFDYDDEQNEEIDFNEENDDEINNTIDYNEVIKNVTKKADYKIKNEEVKPKKKKANLNFKDNEVGNLIKIILIITGVVLVLYLVTLVYLKKDEVKEEENEITATIQYEEILGSKLLSQSPKEYYVFAYKEDDLYLTSYNIYIGNYQYKENSKKVYRMNLDLGFNEQYVGEKSNLKGGKVEELKFADTTLIKVKKKKVVEVYEGKEKILEHLRSITK
ncbi:MAG: hypothetical protein II309_05675 [Bacilli bacterium]|nr:hypothetical protein [Bacilli bacterium]